MLKISNISKTFNPGTINEKKALSDLSLHLAKGDFVTILGSNGAGKSTLFNAIAGTFPVDRAPSRWMGRTSPACRTTSAVNSSGACSRIR